MERRARPLASGEATCYTRPMALDPFQGKINDQCPGFTGDAHWLWQERTFTAVPSIRDVCMLGVYYGRDTAYAATLLERLRGEDFHVTAVDLFSDAPCEDWPEEKRGMTWEEAGFGPAPTLETTQANLCALGLDTHVTLVKSPAEEFLRTTDQEFDFIFIDTSHDYETTKRTMQLALKRLRPLGLLAGDDFSDKDTWGVRKAVTELCPNVRTFMTWIWYAAGAEFKQGDSAPPQESGNTP